MITKGERRMTFLKDNVSINENEMFIINILQPHAIDSLCHDYIVVTVKGLSDCPFFCNRIISEQCNQLFFKLIYAIQGKCEGELIFYWDSLYEYLCQNQTVERPYAKTDKIVEKTLDFIVRNHHNPVSVNDIAQHACMSVFHFCRVFKSLTGMSPHQYLMQYRISCSHEHLQNKMPVFDTAIESGFYDSSHFVRTFFNYMALTPKAYQLSIFEK
jgi:AraC-like DNA-binding protein